MAAPIQTLTLDSHYSIARRIVAPALRSRLGGGGTQVRRRYERPIYEFILKDSHAIKSAAEALYGFMQYHQQDMAFWYAGDEWGNVQTPILYGFGDGTRREFFLNNRNITTGTLATSRDGTPDVTGTAPSIDLASGLLTYAFPPGATVRLTAAYQCRYKCVFAPDSDVLQSEEQFYQKLFRYEGIVLREQVP